MATILPYAWLIPALPLLAAVVITLFGKRLPTGFEKGGWIAVLLVGLAGALGVATFYEGTFGADRVTWEEPFTEPQVEWFKVGEFEVNFGIYLDPLTVFMLFTVGILVTLICLYSTGYMHEEGPARRRYYAELTLFITGMLGMVVASNLLMAFVFWEIMGLCSYLLIGYWYHKPSAASAAKKAFLTTRVGDAFLLVGLGILLIQFKTLDYETLFEMVKGGIPSGVDREALVIANLCIFAGAVGKSAQFPLHVWLPDAMEGPTTVSALIHAATMVKAGVYLVARSYPLFVLTPEVLVIVAVIGGFTALFAATLALTNWDLKRVLAYSTLSQLGYMFLGLGVAGLLWYVHADDPAHGGAMMAVALTGVTVAIFHLFSHAFFKAGLFLSAGSVGHTMHHARNPYDMRAMGGLRKHMPITAFAMLMGCISIAGIPPFSGFYSKDAILHRVFEAAMDGGGILYWALYAMAVITAAMTAYYMFRLYFLTFEGRHRGPAWLEERRAAAGEVDEHLGEPGHEGHAGDAVTPHTAAAPDHDHAHDHDHGRGPAGPGAHAAVHTHSHHGDGHLHESPWSMTVPLAILGVFAIVGGMLALAFAGGEFDALIHVSPENAGAAGATTGVAAPPAPEPHGVASALIHPFMEPTTYVSIAAALVGIGLAWSMWKPAKVEESITLDSQARGITRVWANRYYIDRVYDRVFGAGTLRQAEAQDRFDAEVIDGAVNGVATGSSGLGERARRWNTGFVQDYALTMAMGLMIIILVAIYVPQAPGIVDTIRGYLGLGGI